MVTLMISNITYKATACMQLSLYGQLQALARTHPRAAVLATLPVCILDVAAEIVKRPVAAIENVASSIINVLGLSCFREYSLPDACQNIKTAGAMLGTTVTTSIGSLLNLLESLPVNLSDPKNAHSCNKAADEQANLPAIAYDSNERRDLLATISNGKGPVVIGELLANKILTHQSIGRALEDAAENNHIDAVSMLLADSRLTKQSIGRALEDAAENNHSEIVSLLLTGLNSTVLAKYNRNEELGLSEIKELQENNLFIRTCLSKAKKIAINNGYSELMNHLDAIAEKLFIDID